MVKRSAYRGHDSDSNRACREGSPVGVPRWQSGRYVQAARIFGSLADADVNLLMIAQGSSEVNISVLITEKDVQRAVRAAHAAFGLGVRTLPAPGRSA
ncbi:MAG: ACT domain-containing protein [Candidatus Cryosericum sp.]